jgi:hypothetical protein
VHPGASVSFGHIQRRLPEPPVCSGLISRTGNGKEGRGIPNLTWEECVKRYLKDWSCTKELALDRREGKLAIHVLESWSSVPLFYCLFILVFLLFIHPFSPFIVFQFFYCLSPLFCLFFIALPFSPSFSPLVCLYFLAPMGFISSLSQLAWD